MRILFVGNFLSKHKGTLNPSERIVTYLQSVGYAATSASSCQNLFLRFADIACSSVFRRYDCVHIDVFSGKAMWFAILSTALARIRRKKVVLNLHGGKLAEVYPLKKKRMDFLLRTADVLVTPSRFLQDFFSRSGFVVDHIPNAIDLKCFPYSWNVSHVEKRKLLWIRAFAEVYRPLFAVDIFYKVLRLFPDATLTMIGPDGGLKKKTVDHITRLGIDDSVQLLDAMENKFLYSYYGSHSLFLNTTLYESFGICVLEAMACGIPVVTSSVGEIPFLWKRDVDALLVSSNNVDDFVIQISRIFQEKSLGEMLSSSARSKALTFDWESTKDRWIKLFTDLHSNRYKST